MKNNRVSNKKLLVTKSDQRWRKIYRRIWYMLKNEKQNRGTNREVNDKWSTKEAVDVSNSRLYYKIAIMSRTKEVDLNLSYFLCSFLFYFWFIFLYSIFRTRVRVRVIRSRCYTAGHIRWYGHKSHNTWKKVEGSRRNDVIQHVKHMLTLRCTHGHLG